MSAGCRLWDSCFKIIRCFFVQRVEFPLYSLSGACVHWYSNDCFLLLQTNFLSWQIITNYFTTTLCNFSRGVLIKHILKNIQGEPTLSKTCSYRTATSLKRVFATGVFLRVCKQLFYRTPVNNFIKNFINWLENTRDAVLYIGFSGKKTCNST